MMPPRKTWLRVAVTALASVALLLAVPAVAGTHGRKVRSAAPTPAGTLMCGFVGQGTYADAARGAALPTASWTMSLYGGLGACNGQPDVGCSLQAAVCDDPRRSSAGLEAGEFWVDPATDLRYAEPPLHGSGSCADSTLSGVALLTWPDHAVTVVSFSAVAGQVTGAVLDSVSMRPLKSQRDATGRTVSAPLTVRTTAFAGASLTGSLDAMDCASHGGPSIPYVLSASGDQVAGVLTLTP